MSTEMRPAYLIDGDDTARLDAAVSRFRARAGRDGGEGALEIVGPSEGSGAPALEDVSLALGSMSLTSERRFVLVTGCERLGAKQAEGLAGMVEGGVPDLTVALVVSRPSDRKPPQTMRRARDLLAAAVEAAGGEVLSFERPRARELPQRLVADARRTGLELERQAAELLVERMGESTVRLACELERLATWAGESGRVTREDLEAMIADTSDEAVWALGDAIVAGDGRRAVLAAERLLDQGESPTRLVHQVAGRLREAQRARSALDEGSSPADVKRTLRMPGFAADALLRDLRSTTVERLRAATCAFADLEWRTRGGSERPDDVEVTLAVRRAVGARP